MLLRLYGGKPMSKENLLRGGELEHEVLTSFVMAARGVGPKLYSVFPGGRMEEFCDDAVVIRPEDSADLDLMDTMARKLATLHATDMPFSKKPKDVLTLISNLITERWSDYLQAVAKRKGPDTKQMKDALDLVTSVDILSLIAWFRETEPRIKGKVVLCHGDMNPGNCLVRKHARNPEDRLILIDYEFTAYSYRGVDIGNQFHYRTFDLSAIYDGRMDQGEYPSQEERRRFVRAYLEQLKRDPGYDFNHETDNEYQVLLEAEFYGPVQDIFLQSLFINGCEREGGFFATIPVHPVILMSRTIIGMQQGQARVMDLLAKGKLPSL